ncbi:hypothetical protein GQ457_07G003760 [Hibiscus cannabinus]
MNAFLKLFRNEFFLWLLAKTEIIRCFRLHGQLLRENENNHRDGPYNYTKRAIPNLDHKMCARHIYAAWLKKYKGMHRKIQFWNTIRATFLEDFDEQLKKLEAWGKKPQNNF